MRCHYEVLGLSLNASLDEIKKAYRKCALQWHPDKHPENKEEANRKFLEVQDAYETLSNDQERAWYDSHREVLISGGKPGESNQEIYTFNIYPYFSSSCFRGFGDDENGFYTVYREMFIKIAEEDRPYYDEQVHIPEFGLSDSDYDSVVGPFYAFWSSYCTPRSFVWAEAHDTREATERQVRRLMEKENKKLRDKAKKERNEEIRRLVEFVRKKDKRVEQYKKLLEEKAQLAQKKAKEKKEADRLRRAEQMKNYVEPEWSTIDRQLEQLELDEKKKRKQQKSKQKQVNLDESENENEQDTNNSNEQSSQSSNDEGNDEGNDDDDDDDEDDDVSDELYCVACDKSFKSIKSFANHEKSKKHRENIELLKRHMKQEDDNFLSKSGSLNNSARDNDLNNHQDDDDQLKSSNPSQISSNKLSKKQKKKRRQMKNEMLNKAPDGEEDEDDDDDDDEPTQGEDEKEKTTMTPCEKPDDSDELEDKNQSKPVSKKNKKKTNPIAKTADQDDNDAQDTEKPLKCSVCDEEFTSRNKLFDHIKTEGHAALKTADSDQPLSHNAVKRNKRLAKLVNKK